MRHVSLLNLAAAALLLAAPLGAAAQDTMSIYNLSPESNPTVFAVVEHWQDQGISLTHPVSDIDLSFSVNGDNAMDALTAPNGLSNDDWPFEWFSADIDVVADGRMFRQGWGDCIPWENDLTYCNMDGDGGTFLIEREISAEALRFHLILRLSPDEIAMNAEDGIDIRPGINVFWPENGYGANMILPDGTEGRVTFILPLSY